MLSSRKKLLGLFDIVPVVVLTVFLLFVMSGKMLEKYVNNYLNYSELTEYTQEIIIQTNKILTQAKEIIHEVNSSPHEFCSYNDLRFIRNIVYSNSIISDLGRLKYGQLACSALLGNDTPRSHSYNRGVSRADGSTIYGEIPLFSSYNTGVVYSENDANLVFNSGLFAGFEKNHYSYSIYTGSLGHNTVVRLFHYPAQNNIEAPYDMTGEKSWVANGRHFHKLCSAENYICVVAGVDSKFLFSKHKIIDTILMMLSLIIGGLSALLILRYFHKEQTLAIQLQYAITRHELDVYYQPIVNVKTGQIIAFEALIRWEIRPGDYVPADILIETAEKGGFITRITCYVLARVKEDIKNILRKHPELRVNINIAACDLQYDKFYQTLSSLQKEGIRPDQIGIELTERSAVDCHTFQGIERLRNLGHKVYLDDFGTGYSSLALLGDIQVDALKIDKAFTQTIGTDALTVSIVPQIISIAKKYKLGIVVEGVETEAQVAYFKAQPLSIAAQGWFFGKPQNINDVYRLLGIKSKKKKK